MRYEFAQLHRQLGTTMIYVTHDQVEAMTLADRIVVLNGGHIEQVGTPAELYDSPATRFVAGFIGAPAMNLIPAVLADGTGSAGAAVRLPNGQTIETAIAPGALRPGAALTLGIRPEHIRSDSPANRLTGSIRLVESLGSVHHVHLDIAGLEEPIVASLPARPVGDTLTIALPIAAIHLFDGDGHALVRSRAEPRVAA
jgi:multiple sugar transport system ATP-binding protein